MVVEKSDGSNLLIQSSKNLFNNQIIINSVNLRTLFPFFHSELILDLNKTFLFPYLTVSLSTYMLNYKFVPSNLANFG